jgi:hypothetical protein
MTRRALILAATACALRADDTSDVWELFSTMASALADNKPDEFMNAFDRKMPGYQNLQTDIYALLETYEIHTSIELVNEDGDSAARVAELDWYLQIVEKQDTAGVTRRRELVRCRLMKQKKKWRITSLEPLSFFAPPTGVLK